MPYIIPVLNCPSALMCLFQNVQLPKYPHVNPHVKLSIGHKVHMPKCLCCQNVSCHSARCQNDLMPFGSLCKFFSFLPYIIWSEFTLWTNCKVILSIVYCAPRHKCNESIWWTANSIWHISLRTQLPLISSTDVQEFKIFKSFHYTSLMLITLRCLLDYFIKCL